MLGDVLYYVEVTLAIVKNYDIFIGLNQLSGLLLHDASLIEFQYLNALLV